MANVFDVAKYILEKTGRQSTWKLQKLCYYSQAWTLAWDGVQLFDEDFEAWANGPVCPELFRQHRGKFSVDANDLDKGDPNNLNSREVENVNIVIRDYGSMSPYELRELSHSEAPWEDARNGAPEGFPSNTIISKGAMAEYYGGL